jgi:hypothetical protein
MNTVPFEDRVRVRAFKKSLIKVIPRFPNDKASLKEIERKSIADVMIDYVNWQSRYVPPRPRIVTVEPAASAHPRYQTELTGIEAFLSKVRNGEDVTPYLSLEPHTKGYTPAARAVGATPEDRWSDKDQVLNVMGFHHFHLGAKLEAKGHIERTNDLLFAHFSRDSFTVIAVFDHRVFNTGSSERQRLHQVHYDRIARAAAGNFVIMSAVATSGHPIHVTRYVQACARTMKEFDPQLDDPKRLAEFYRRGNVTMPKKPKLDGVFKYLDFGFGDRAMETFFILHKGWV